MCRVKNECFDFSNRHCGTIRKHHLKDNYSGNYELFSNAHNPFLLGCKPDMDISFITSPDKASCYHTIIGVLSWMVELGRVDIAVEVYQLLSLLAMPRKGYMLSALHIMSYLRIRQNSCLVLDPSYPDIHLSEFNSYEKWTAFYGDAK